MYVAYQHQKGFIRLVLRESQACSEEENNLEKQLKGRNPKTSRKSSSTSVYSIYFETYHGIIYAVKASPTTKMSIHRLLLHLDYHSKCLQTSYRILQEIVKMTKGNVSPH